MTTWRAGVVTVSDRCARGEAVDESGPALVRLLEQAGYEVATATVVPDGDEPVAGALRDAAAAGCQLVVTTGGTGLSPRDRTPEGTRAVIDFEVPGLAEAMRAAGRASTPFADLSRGLVGVTGVSIVVNVPGSVRGAVESLTTLIDVLPHALAQLRGGDHGHG